MYSNDKPKIVVIGSSNMDLIMKVPELPKPGETVGSGEFYKKYGGKGANQAVAATRAGGQVTFVTCVGNDPHGNELLDNYTLEGIHIQHVIRSHKPTGVAIINVSNSSGENSISVAPGANYELLPIHIKEQDVFAHQEYLILQNEILPETIEYIIKNTPTAVKIVYNPAPYFPISTALLRRINVLVLNETEAQELLHIAKIDASADSIPKMLNELSLNKVIITLGKNGCYHWERKENKLIHTPANDVEAIDTTGAGDTFCGYLTVGLSKNWSLSKCVEIANAAAAKAVQKIGAQESIPYRSELSN